MEALCSVLIRTHVMWMNRLKRKVRFNVVYAFSVWMNNHFNKVDIIVNLDCICFVKLWPWPGHGRNKSSLRSNVFKWNILIGWKLHVVSVLSSEEGVNFSGFQKTKKVAQKWLQKTWKNEKKTFSHKKVNFRKSRPYFYKNWVFLNKTQGSRRPSFQTFAHRPICTAYKIAVAFFEHERKNRLCILVYFVRSQTWRRVYRSFFMKYIAGSSSYVYICMICAYRCSCQSYWRLNSTLFRVFWSSNIFYFKS